MADNANHDTDRCNRRSRQVGLLGVYPALVAACCALVTGTIADKRAANAIESNYEVIDGSGQRHAIRAASGATEQTIASEFRNSVQPAKSSAADETVRSIREIDPEEERAEALAHFAFAGLCAIFASLWWVLTQSVGFALSRFDGR